MGQMKALVLHNTEYEPWLDKIASGEKTIETRIWKTSYRGEILLCQSRSSRRGDNDGKAVMVATIVDCRLMRPEDVPASGGVPYDPTRWCWVLQDVKVILTPFPISGFQRIFNVETPASFLTRPVQPKK